MAINSLRSSSHGISGLVSGMNTEDIVNKLLSGTQSKIDAANAKKTQLTYKRDIYRTINSSIRALQSKYFSFASQNNTNLLSNTFFQNMSAKPVDDKILSAIATSGARPGKMEITVNKLAQNMSISTNNGKVSGAITGEFDLKALQEATKDGKTISIELQLDGATNKIELSANDVKDENALKNALTNKINQTLGGGITVNVNGTNGKGTISFDTEGNRTLTFKSDVKELGIKSGASNRVNLNSSLEKSGLASKLEGDRFEFSINGVDFSFDKSDSINRIIERVNSSKAGVTLSYSAVNDSFKLESNTGGKDSQITLEQRSGNLLSVMFGEDVIGKADAFSTPELKLVNPDVDAKITGETKLSELGLTGGTLTIGDKKIEYKADMTIAEFNQKLADEKIAAEIGINLSPPRFVFAGTKLPIPISIAPASQAGGTTDAKADFEKLFGTSNYQAGANGTAELKSPANPQKSVITTNADGKVTATKNDATAGTELTNSKAGQSAEVIVNGTAIERNTNSFSVDGVTLDIKETGKTTINITQNNDAVFDGIKGFMDDYNKLIDEMWTYLKQDTNYKKYAPLTQAQKAEMTDKEIELWEEKAKEGLLRSDPTLRAITDAMQSVLNTRVNGVSLADLGITTTYDMEKGYGGKLVFTDSTGDKFREAISADPEKVKSLFLDENGISSKFNDVLRSSTTKGQAGSQYYNLSLVDIAGTTGITDTSSKIYSEMSNIDKNINRLQMKYESEYSRYWKQFNAMEQMIAQMNQQSAWLAQQFM